MGFFSEPVRVNRGMLIAGALAWGEGFNSKIEKAWLGDDEGIGVMLGRFAGIRFPNDPEAASAMGDRLTGWDREVFLRALTGEWASRNPSKAWAWATGDAPASLENLAGVQRSPATLGTSGSARGDNRVGDAYRSG